MKALIRAWISIFEIIQFMWVDRLENKLKLKGDTHTLVYLATSRLSLQDSGLDLSLESSYSKIWSGISVSAFVVDKDVTVKREW